MKKKIVKLENPILIEEIYKNKFLFKTSTIKEYAYLDNSIYGTINVIDSYFKFKECNILDSDNKGISIFYKCDIISIEKEIIDDKRIIIFIIYINNEKYKKFLKNKHFIEIEFHMVNNNYKDITKIDILLKIYNDIQMRKIKIQKILNKK